MTAPELAPRYAPGEDVVPLVRAVGGGGLGALAALLVDRIWPSLAGRIWLWPALAASVAVGDPGASAIGVWLVLGAAVLASVVFAYGQFRRFVPGRPVAAGLAWGGLVWLVAAPVLLPRAAAWLGAPSGAAAPAPAASLVVPALVAVAESVVTVAVWSAVLGVTNPSRAS